MVYECSTPPSREERRQKRRFTDLKSHDSARCGEFIRRNLIATKGMSIRIGKERDETCRDDERRLWYFYWKSWEAFCWSGGETITDERSLTWFVHISTQGNEREKHCEKKRKRQNQCPSGMTSWWSDPREESGLYSPVGLGDLHCDFFPSMPWLYLAFGHLLESHLIQQSNSSENKMKKCCCCEWL